MPELVARSEKQECGRGYGQEGGKNYRKAGKRREIRGAEEAVAEAVDHIEEGVGMRQPLPERRQRMDRVEDAREKRERHDDEVLKCRHLIDRAGPHAGDEAERAEER